MSTQNLHPWITWAQRPKLIILTIQLSDCKDPEIKVDADKLHFKGIGGPDKKCYEANLEFFKEIDTEASKFAVRDRVIEFALEKKEEGPYWDRLLKKAGKQHWLKIDFNKWKNEDDSDDEGAAQGGPPGGAPGGGGGDLEEMMRSMGGLGGMGGMGGMGGPGGMPGMPGMGGMPGGMGGMPGMPGMGDMGKMERPNLDDLDAEDDSDDEDLPDLE